MLTFRGVWHVTGLAAVGTPDARGSFGLEFCEEVILGFDLNWAGGVKGGMGSFAVGAVQGGGGTAADDGLEAPFLGARAIGAGASVLGVGVVFSAQRACGVFLFAGGLVMAESEALGAVGGGGRRAESSDTACPGE